MKDKRKKIDIKHVVIQSFIMLGAFIVCTGICYLKAVLADRDGDK